MSRGWFDAHRDIISVSGPDALNYLHSQLSQEVRQLAVGQSTWSFLLQPTGKVDALVRVLRTGDESFTVDVDAGFGDAVVTRLGRFKIRVKAEITATNWRAIAVRGAGASHVVAGDDEFVVPCGWPGVEGVDLIGADPQPPADWPELELMDAVRLRIEAGWPAMGSELDEHTIPGETGVVPLAVSFTKGCYPGQELVERIDSRGGNVPRRLRLVRAEGFLDPGVELTIDDARVGRVTSVTFAADGGTIGLAYVSRSVEMPATAQSASGPVTLEAFTRQ
jgi:folate-binding protein YgfZ